MSLLLVGVWLAAVGLSDLGRATGAPARRSRSWWCLAGGATTLLAGLLVAEVSWPSRVVLGVLGSVLLAGWSLPLPVPVRVACFTTGLTGALLLAGLVDADRPWPHWLAATVLAEGSTSAVVVTVGVLLAQLSTANLLVRLLLDAVGVPATTNEKQLRGGRFLGPMERILIVCLGALGEVTATSIAIAAKGLLRFPELQRAQRRAGPPPDGPSDVTEYFLIGSLASWLLALGGAALVHLAA